MASLGSGKFNGHHHVDRSEIDPQDYLRNRGEIPKKITPAPKFTDMMVTGLERILSACPDLRRDGNEPGR